MALSASNGGCHHLAGTRVWSDGVNCLFKSVMAAATLAAFPLFEEAHAIDLSGAWAVDADQCSHVFTRKGRARQIGFTARSQQHGGGFVVEADRLKGKSASCKIKIRKEEGQTVNIIAGCATDIMLSNVQFSLKVLEPNKISRIFPGMQDMEISYYRCSI
jgi:ribosomal protein L34